MHITKRSSTFPTGIQDAFRRMKSAATTELNKGMARGISMKPEDSHVIHVKNARRVATGEDIILPLRLETLFDC